MWKGNDVKWLIFRGAKKRRKIWKRTGRMYLLELYLVQVLTKGREWRTLSAYMHAVIA